MLYTLRSKIAPRAMKKASMIASCAAIGQITLGAVVIIERLHALLVTVHLGLGLILFSMILITVLYSKKIIDIEGKLKTSTSKSSTSTSLPSSTKST
jgi:heme A synthase